MSTKQKIAQLPLVGKRALQNLSPPCSFENFSFLDEESHYFGCLKDNRQENKFASRSGIIYDYFIFYSKTSVSKKVSISVFKKVEGKVLTFPSFKVKIHGESNPKIRERVKGFFTEGITDQFSNVLSALRLLWNTLEKIGSTLKDGSLKNFVIRCIKIICEFNLLIETKFSVYSVLNCILSLYMLQEDSGFKVESAESLIISSIISFLPKSIQLIIQRMTSISSAKILDDFTGFHSLVVGIVDLVNALMVKLPVDESIKEKIFATFSFLSSFKYHLLLKNTQSLLEEVQKDPKLFSKIHFQKRVKSLQLQFDSDKGIADWVRRSPAMANIVSAFDRVYKVVLSYDNISRLEPACFVFEGPPGCLKSVTMNLVVAAMNKTVYTHTIPCADDSKDWYDNYQNEEVLVMDDVGQQGISQYRSLINMVSTVRLPLPCADAKLKDTKFFNSETILFTTNIFKNIQGLTKQDCISDITALWRRGYVFDFAEAKNVDGYLKGKIVFNYFDIISKTWKAGFPADVLNYAYKLNVDLNHTCTCDRDPIDYVTWILKIISLISRMKKFEHSQHQDNKTVIAAVQANLSLFFSEGKTKTSDVYNSIKYKEIGPNAAEEKAINNIFRSLYTTTIEYDVPTVMEVWRDTLLSFFTDSISWISTHSIHCVPVLLLLFSLCLFSYKFSYSNNFVPESKISGFLKDNSVSSNHPTIDYVQQAVKDVDVYFKDKKYNSRAICSGRFVILPSHLSLEKEGFLTIYKNRTANHILVDKESIELVWTSKEDDVSLFSLPASFPSPFKSLVKHFKPLFSNFSFHETFFCTDLGSIPLSKIRVFKNMSATYKGLMDGIHQFSNTFNSKKDFLYEIHEKGLCGSPIVDVEGGILGFHVSGSDDVNIGVSLAWSSQTISTLRDFLSSESYQLDVNISDKILQDSGVIKFVNTSYYGSNSSDSSLAPTPLFNLYPVTRLPANLRVNGFHTVKDMAKKSFGISSYVSEEELKFSKEVLKSMLCDFGDLTEQQVIKGTNFLAPLNKDSSSGFGYSKNKEDYINFEDGFFTPLFLDKLNNFNNLLVSNKYPVEHFLWIETLKDEIRNEEKVNTPRTFRVGTLLNQVLTKKFFGKMVEHIISNRSFNQIMVGVNPFSEWDSIFQTLKNCDIVFAGDIKNWDGSMLPQVQRMVLDTIMSFYKGADFSTAKLVLDSIIHSLVLVQDDFYMTTHSMPSGSFLTAILNSIVNKVYTAIWYFRNSCKPTVNSFWNDVVDYVYGDDKLNGIRNNKSVNLNAITMRSFFESIGMGFTDSLKNPIVSPSQDLSEVTFLKRYFCYHNILKKIMCPLELRTIENTLSWFDSKKVCDDVMRDKIHAVQREFYLHPNREFLLSDFYKRMDQRNYPYTKLTPDYLKYLYTQEPDSISYCSSVASLYF